MITPEEAAEKYWEIHNKLMREDTLPSWAYHKCMTFKTMVAVMAEFLPQVTEDAVAEERARCAGICRKWQTPTSQPLTVAIVEEIIEEIEESNDLQT